MSAHAEQVYPEECCGLMLGEIESASVDGASVDIASKQKRLIELLPLENKWSADEAVDGSISREFTKARRYTIDPVDMLRSQKQAREKGLKIIGIYHSHPDHVAVPSECDRIQAWATYAYVIVSVCEGKAVDVQNWTLDSEHQFQPELMDLLPQRMTDEITERMPASAARHLAH